MLSMGERERDRDSREGIIDFHFWQREPPKGWAQESPVDFQDFLDLPSRPTLPSWVWCIGTPWRSTEWPHKFHCVQRLDSRVVWDQQHSTMSRRKNFAMGWCSKATGHGIKWMKNPEDETFQLPSFSLAFVGRSQVCGQNIFHTISLELRRTWTWNKLGTTRDSSSNYPLIWEEIVNTSPYRESALFEVSFRWKDASSCMLNIKC